MRSCTHVVNLFAFKLVREDECTDVRVALKCSHLLKALMRAVIHPLSREAGLFTVQIQRKKGHGCATHLALRAVGAFLCLGSTLTVLCTHHGATDTLEFHSEDNNKLFQSVCVCGLWKWIRIQMWKWTHVCQQKLFSSHYYTILPHKRFHNQKDKLCTQHMYIIKNPAVWRRNFSKSAWSIPPSNHWSGISCLLSTEGMRLLQKLIVNLIT